MGIVDDIDELELSTVHKAFLADVISNLEAWGYGVSVTYGIEAGTSSGPVSKDGLFAEAPFTTDGIAVVIHNGDVLVQKAYVVNPDSDMVYIRSYDDILVVPLADPRCIIKVCNTISAYFKDSFSGLWKRMHKSIYKRHIREVICADQASDRDPQGSQDEAG